MDLSHQFTVPTGVEETWAHFQDIAGLAACFPGATVTSAEAESFSGSVKVKLGPIALVYNGTGTFTEKDDAAHRFVVDAKGKDKRGNGTAGAVVTLAMAEAAGGGTEVDVRTDLNITGKPAQFGRGAMQDVSDKLLGQFVQCLEERLSGASEPEPVATTTQAEPAAAAGPPPPPSPLTSAALAPPGGQHRDDDALDLGATVLPVLLKTYRNQIAAALGLLLIVLLLRRRRG